MRILRELERVMLNTLREVELAGLPGTRQADRQGLVGLALTSGGRVAALITDIPTPRLRDSDSHAARRLLRPAN